MRRLFVFLSLVTVLLIASCSGPSVDDSGPTILQLFVPSDGPNSMDPAQGATMYDNTCVSQVYETLLQDKYLKRPLELEPLLLAEMPTTPDDGLTYHFKLKQDVRFQDDPCFPDGVGRKMVAADVIYSWKRLADSDVSLKNWWLLEKTIKGLDAHRDAFTAAKKADRAAKFDYDAPIEGMEIINDHEFKITLTEKVQRFLWTLAMFQMSILPREAVEKYGIKFGRHPVGTGPFKMAEDGWIPQKSMSLTRNPNYHECYYPSEWMPEDEALGLHKAAGQRIPFVDGVEVTFFTQDQPLWLSFRAGKLDFSRVPKDNFGEAFNKRTKKLKPSFRKEGIVDHAVPQLDFIYYGFNMEDELLGGYTDEKRALRQAISLALDWEERNDIFYNNVCQIYDGMIPPGLNGYPQGGEGPVSYRGPDLERARELLAKAGYPGGEGLPTIDYYTSIEGPGKEMAEMTMKQLRKIGINLNPRLDVFSAFDEKLKNRKCGFFSLAWHSDYPDAENNLALFYSRNKSPGANNFIYDNPEFDKLYEQIRSMPKSDDRTKIIERMRDMVLEDAPFCGSLARTRYYLVNPWLKNCKPSEDFQNWWKYLDLDESRRR
ncbi:MAG: ABC transporter substrate-binding protein [Pirellulales bacterium]